MKTGAECHECGKIQPEKLFHTGEFTETCQCPKQEPQSLSSP